MIHRYRADKCVKGKTNLGSRGHNNAVTTSILTFDSDGIQVRIFPSPIGKGLIVKLQEIRDLLRCSSSE